MKYSLALLKYITITILFLLLVFFQENRTVQAETITSPDGRIEIDFCLKDGVPQYRCLYNSTKVIDESSLGWKFKENIIETAIKTISRTKVDNTWTPLWGERSEISNRYNAIMVELTGKYAGKPIAWNIEFRVYNEGFAFRYILPNRQSPDRQSPDRITGEITEFRLPKDAVVFPINSTEATYPEEPISLSNFKMSYAPLTGKFSNGYSFSIMEACAQSYPRFKFGKNDQGAVILKVPETDCGMETNTFQSAWRLVLLAKNECELVENEYMIYNLNPAPSESFDWVKPGLTISNEGNCDIRAVPLKSMIDFAAENNMKYLQIDWGWYGTEWVYTDSENEEWAKNNPEKASDPTWRSNTKPTPYKVARGLVPYFPRFKSSTYVDIDIEDLVRYGKSKGIGICLYLNDRMIKKYDIGDLFSVYERWGLSGLKPGFVAYGSAKNSDELRYLAQTAAEHKLWLCIHDAFLPDGMARTFPNVTCVEGGGGQEGNHPVHHDTVLPFTRGLVGVFDYTPKFYVNGRSNAHQMSLLITLYNPTPVLRGGWAIRDNHSGQAFGSEKEFFRHFQSKWLETKVLDGEIGKYIVTARKAESGKWLLGATGGTKAVKRTISLEFLEKETDYIMTLWTDDPKETNGWRGTIKTVRTVKSTDTIELPMAPGGGAIAVFEPREEGDFWCFFGTYTSPPSPEMKQRGSIKSNGIQVARYNSKTGQFSRPRLAATTMNPSWLTIAPDGRTLYSVGEGNPANNTAYVTSWTINTESGTLTRLNEQETGGASPCHLALSPIKDPLDNRYIAVSNYGGGDFVFYRIESSGKIGPETSRFILKSSETLENGSKRIPHAHSTAFSNRSFGDKYRVYLCDLGNDSVHVGFLDKKTGRFSIDTNIQSLNTVAEAGPRHMIIDTQNDHDLVLVVNENGSTVNAYRVYDNRSESLGTVFTLPRELEGKVTWRKNLVDGKKYTQYNACAEIIFDQGCHYVYVTNRGHDSIAVYHYNYQGKNASDILQMKQIISTEGSFPRNIELDPNGRFLIASNQLEGTVLTFARDPKSGLLQKTANPPLMISYPLSILFVPDSGKIKTGEK